MPMYPAASGINLTNRACLVERFCERRGMRWSVILIGVGGLSLFIGGLSFWFFRGDSNYLKNEKSPYLLGHADNPVNWYPWGEKAFKQARQKNKLIFLSIGYSTCHWCHVMEHESFENKEVARLMNQTFINIKVDREERPDIDAVYMQAAYLLTGHGGWPLTIVMTPEKQPFFAATYIPRESQSGKMGLLELIPRIERFWIEHPEKLTQQAKQITAHLKGFLESDQSSKESLTYEVAHRAYQDFKKSFDSTYGGFGQAPKFPSPHNLLFLLRYSKRTNSQKALEMVKHTLKKMRLGGIFDHLGFGFHRYSTDSRWVLPHFEKMLYDQALLALAYCETYQSTHDAFYKKVAQEIFSYVLGSMKGVKEGAFYSAIDADSEGEEGKFYLWSLSEIHQVLADEAIFVAKHFNFKKEGNFPQVDFHKEGDIKKTKKNVLYLSTPFKPIEEQRWEKLRKRLFAQRQKRVLPLIDDKILTNWNGLMIAALAKGARILGEPRYLKAAQAAADFILNKMYHNNKLLHRYRSEDAAIEGYLEDYAFFIWGLLEIYESGFDVKYLKTALALSKSQQDLFWDKKRGGFYFVSVGQEELPARHKPIYDGALLSGNSVAFQNLLRLSRITGNIQWERWAQEIARAFARRIIQRPTAHTYFLQSLSFYLGSSYEVVIVGDLEAADTKAMFQALYQRFIPAKVVVSLGLKGNSAITAIANYTQNQRSLQGGQATAYVCKNFTCRYPTSDPKKMLQYLGESK